MSIFDKILAARGLDDNSKAAFLSPDYALTYDPYLLPDMDRAVKRLLLAKKRQDNIVIYGDYDIDGLTASVLLFDALKKFGFINVDIFMPNRFVEGYGMTIDSVKKIAIEDKANLIVTVDCGSLSEKEIIEANKLGVDVIVTDHHTAANVQPPAVAVINPKRADSKYPFSGLAGVGVAFKLVQAMQKKMKGLPIGQEKWYLDLVAFGTICDIVPLIDENRIYAYWGLKVLAKTKHIGLSALMLVAGVNPRTANARSLGFGLGPRMNAAGRLKTAQYALDLLICNDLEAAATKAQYLDKLNKSRQSDQAKILIEASAQAEMFENDSVLVLSGKDWNHGIIGIVAAKILEKYKKPVFIFQELGEKSKGSARSYGDFSAVDSINYKKDILISGGGHKFAAGVTLYTKDIGKFRKSVNDFYNSQKLKDQQFLLLPVVDVEAKLSELDEALVEDINLLEPFGNCNSQPVFKTDNLIVRDIKKMGDNGQHIKIELQDIDGYRLKFIAFGAPDHFFVNIGQKVSVTYSIDVNDWNNIRSIEGKLLHLELLD
ncbi:MAG: single-stranded-DNA-specific exonuclease RecJ [Candidatus Saccharibacteria bacterium]